MVNNKNMNPSGSFSRPKGRSFEEFKEWYMALAASLGAKGEPVSDEKLRETWRLYIEALDKRAKKP